MSQHPQNMTPDLVKGVIHLLAHGDSEEWKKVYRQIEFQEVVRKVGSDCITMDFEYSERVKLYTYVNNRVLGKAPIDYLEFGVANGSSILSWLEINKHEDSRFYGFDSFEGLPEDWIHEKGSYSTNGILPETSDDRVEFVKGLFQDTVDDFSLKFTTQNRLVLHMDADLYSSTLYVLMNMGRHIRPGTVVLFDEFTSRSYTDEFAALQDYCTACYREYSIVATRSDFVKLAVEITK